MATSGRRRRRLGVALVVAAALVPAGAAAVRGGGRSWCEAQPSVAWRRVLRHHVVPLSRTVSLDPWTLAHDGRSFFATVYSPGFSGVARIDARTSRLTKIRAFPHPRDDQADGAFDGRWLVWDEYHGFDSFDDFTVWAWDSRTGGVRKIGAAVRSPAGAFWPSSWRQPDVRDGIATWVQGSGPDGLTAVHVYDLRAGRGSIVHEGHAGGSFLLAGKVVAWPESPAPAAETRMRAASAITGKPLRPPRSLRSLRGVSGIVTDGRRIAYPNAGYTSLWWSPSPEGRPRRILAARGDDHVDNSVQIGGRYLGFGMQPRVFVGDTRTHRYMAITAHSGWTRIDRKSLLVLFATGSKALDARAPIAFVSLRDLPPMPVCR